MRKWLPLLAVGLGSFMLMVDVTIVNVAVPAMATDLSASFGSLQWVIDAYALMLAVLLLGLGALSDAHGHRRIYLAGLGVFALASVVCGLAPTAGVLVAARAAQGIGGAAMFATTFALINMSYGGRDRGTAYGVFGAVSGGAAALGPVIGGLLIQALSWRWIFFVNVPVSIATILLAVAVLPAAAGRGGRRIDLAGTAAFTVVAAALTFALIRSSDDHWSSPTELTLVGVAVLGSLAFVVVEARVRQPLIDLGLFRVPRFAAAVLAALVLSFSGFGVLTVTTIWTQSLLGLTPIASGLVLLPLPTLSATVSLLFGRLMHRVPGWLAIGGGLVLIGLGGLLTALLVSPSAGWGALIAGSAVTGVGLGVSVPTLSRTATEAVGDARSGMAAGAVNTARQLGQAFGIALLGSLTATAAASTLTADGVTEPRSTAGALVGGGARSVLAAATPGSRAGLDQALHGAFASGLDHAFVVAGAVAVVVGVLVAWLLRDRTQAEQVEADRSMVTA